ncbi:hypothetical protein LguiA_035204 [Lonicera macranthoides]
MRGFKLCQRRSRRSDLEDRRSEMGVQKRSLFLKSEKDYIGSLVFFFFFSIY